MKKQFFHQKMFLLVIVVTTALSSYGQQYFTQTCDTIYSNGHLGNSECNGVCTLIRSPQLNDKAILLATPLTAGLNPHLIGVWYKQVGVSSNAVWYWCVINQDGVHMRNGSSFNVQYFANPDPEYQFVHKVNPTATFQTIYKSYIDHVHLNNNPKADFRYIAIGNGTNMWPVTFKYDAAAGKWYLFNDNNKAFDGKASYNIVINPVNAFGKPVISVDTVHKKNIRR